MQAYAHGSYFRVQKSANGLYVGVFGISAGLCFLRPTALKSQLNSKALKS